MVTGLHNHRSIYHLSYLFICLIYLPIYMYLYIDLSVYLYPPSRSFKSLMAPRTAWYRKTYFTRTRSTVVWLERFSVVVDDALELTLVTLETALSLPGVAAADLATTVSLTAHSSILGGGGGYFLDGAGLPSHVRVNSMPKFG